MNTIPTATSNETKNISTSEKDAILGENFNPLLPLKATPTVKIKMASVLTVQEEAREWLEENMEGSSAEYDLSTKRINVVTPLGSFYILHPEGKDDDNWVTMIV